LAAGPGDVAGFAAVRTIVQPIDGEAHSFQAFADGAVFFAGAVFLGFVALRAEHLFAGGHRCLRKKLYLREGRSARGGSCWRCIIAMTHFEEPRTRLPARTDPIAKFV
jgi:hypothetical protein